MRGGVCCPGSMCVTGGWGIEPDDVIITSLGMGSVGGVVSSNSSREVVIECGAELVVERGMPRLKQSGITTTKSSSESEPSLSSLSLSVSPAYHTHIMKVQYNGGGALDNSIQTHTKFAELKAVVLHTHEDSFKHIHTYTYSPLF